MNPLNQFTPGPWLAIPTTVHGRNPDTKRMDIVSNSGEWHPAFVAGDILPSDARLIASAPDLLLALERLIHPMADDEDLSFARDCIANARGK